MPVNYGILQPIQDMSQRGIQMGPSAQANGPAYMNAQTEQGNSIAQSANTLAGNIRANQLQSGLLQQQQLQNQGLSTENQQKSVALQMQQLQAKVQKEQWIFHEADLQAYQKGGIDAYTKSLESHDPGSAYVLKSSMQQHEQMVQEGNVKDLTDASGMWYTIENSKDPMQTFQQMKSVLQRVDPKTPDGFANRQQLDAWAFGSMHTAVNYATQTNYRQQMGLMAGKQDLQTQGNIDQTSINNANTAANGAQKTLSSVDQYETALNQIENWNKENPDKAIKVGPGFTGWEKLKQAVAAAGGPTDALSKMEDMQAASANLMTTAITGLKTMPRSAEVLKPFYAGMANPSDTIATQHTKNQLIKYSAAQAVSYSDFLTKYREQNGNTNGAQMQWSKFLRSDPAIANGNLPDPNYVSEPDNYAPFTDKNYVVPKAQPQSQQQSRSSQKSSSQFQEGKTYQDANGNKAMYQNGKWIPLSMNMDEGGRQGGVRG